VKILLTIVSFIIILGVKATTYTTIGSGSWTDPAVWNSGLVPPLTVDNSDNITIDINHVVSLTGDLIFNNNSIFTINGSLVITGDLTANNKLTLLINGRLVVDGSFSANNNYETTISGDLLVTQNFDVKNNATLDIDGSLTIYGDFTGDNNNVLSGEGEVNVKGSVTGLNTSGFDGSIFQNFSSAIGFSNNGCVIKVGSNDVIYIGGGTKGNYNSMYQGGHDGRIESDGQIILEGNWNNYSGDSVFLNRNSTGSVIFSGDASQMAGGSKATGFEKVVIDNLSGLWIDDNLIIGNTLDFVAGSITTTGTDTVIITNTDQGAISNQGPGKGVVGNLRRYLAIGSYAYPLSDDGDYLPALLEITNLGSMSYLSSKFTPTAAAVVPPGLEVDGTPIVEFLDKGYWTFTPDNGSGVEYNITLTSSGQTNGGDLPSQHAIFKRDASGWESLGTHDNSTQSGTGTDPITVKRSDLTGFSDFIIGKSESFPLPIFLTGFNATCTDQGIEITWVSLMEVNNEYYTLEYSYNAIDFIHLTQVAGAGTSFHENNYSFLHQVNTNEVIYYRLSQTDYNGKTIQYPVVSVFCNKDSGNGFLIDEFTKGHLKFSLSEPNKETLIVSIADQLGRVVYFKKLDSELGYHQYSVSFPMLKTGIYLLHLQSVNHQFSSKIILQ